MKQNWSLWCDKKLKTVTQLLFLALAFSISIRAQEASSNNSEEAVVAKVDDAEKASVVEQVTTEASVQPATLPAEIAVVEAVQEVQAVPQEVPEATPAEPAIPAQEVKPVPVVEHKKTKKESPQKQLQQKLHDATISFAINCHDNATDFAFAFAQGADPLINLLKTAHENDVRIDSLYSSLRIVANLSKSCEYIRDTALNNVLSCITNYTEHYFDESQEKQQQKKAYLELERLIYAQTNGVGEMGFVSPANFSSMLAKKVFKLAKNKLKPSQIKEWQGRLRALIFNHIDHMLGKALWDMQDWPSIWESVLTTANGLYQMSNILEEADRLDDLLWHLTHRFVWFLDFSAGKLPREFYDNIETNIQDGSAFFLELEEQDAIKSKKNVLLNAIRVAREKAVSNDLFNVEIPMQNSRLVSSGEVEGSATKATLSLTDPLSGFIDPVSATPKLLSAKNTTKKLQSGSKKNEPKEGRLLV